MIVDFATAAAASALIGVLTVGIGTLAAVFGRRQQREMETALAEAKQIAHLAAVDAEYEQAITLKTLADKLPPDVTIAGLRSAINVLRLQPDAPTYLHGAKQDRSDPRWSLVEKLVNGYHQQALSQASAQFWFSLAASVVGFALIIYVVLTSTGQSEWQVVLRAMPGAVIEIVAALVFRQASETRRRATDLYDRLRDDNQRTQSLALIDSIDSPRLRAAVKAQIALHMAGISLDDKHSSEYWDRLLGLPEAAVQAIGTAGNGVSAKTGE